MTRSSSAAMFMMAVAIGGARPPLACAQTSVDTGGRWTLNRAASQLPREIGFDVDWASPVGPGSSTAGGGGRGSGAARPSAFTGRRESEDDAKRLQQLTAEARTPSSHLTIADTPAAVTITDDRGRTRTFHPNGRDEEIQLDGVPVGVSATRDAGRLVVLYRVEQGRELRYTYSRTATPPQLVVDVQFLERGKGDRAQRIYEPAGATEVMTQVPAAPPPAAAGSGRSVPGVRGLESGAAAGPSLDRLPAQTYNREPDAEFKGLTSLGLVVEELSPQAAACGLTQGALETAVAKRLTDAGFTIRRNSDEDTYVYVNVITNSLSTGLCVSRYDAFLYTHTTATLSYQTTPVLVQVSLLHRGGMAGGAPAAHADGVVRGVADYVDQFAVRIRAANK